MIRPVTTDDAAAIARIYNHYIETTIVSFEEQPVSAEEIVSRLAPPNEWFVDQTDEGLITGYAYFAPWNQRCAYRHTYELSVYLDQSHTGRGIGKALYQHLIEILRGRRTRAIIGGIALPNPASVALHESLGFEKVAHFKEIGRKFDQWIDVGYWQLTLK